MEFASARRTRSGESFSVAATSSATVFSKKREAIPVAPTLPISSLSTSRQQRVVSVISSAMSSIAKTDEKAHTLSSCPYPRIILLSKPRSFAFPAGTISSSAESRSCSSISYVSARILMIFALSASFSSFSSSSRCSMGRFPIRRSRLSPVTTSAAFFVICSPARCTSRSVITNTGSSSFSPMLTLTTVPSFLAITPWIAMGIAVHWYFLIPP